MQPHAKKVVKKAVRKKPAQLSEGRQAPPPAREASGSQAGGTGPQQRRAKRTTAVRPPPAAAAAPDGELRLHPARGQLAPFTRGLRARRRLRHAAAGPQRTHRAADRVDLEADDGRRRARRRPSAERRAARHRARPRHDQVHRVTPAGRLGTVAPRDVPYRADVVGKPRGRRAEPRLSGRTRRVRQGNEPRSAPPRHAPYALPRPPACRRTTCRRRRISRSSSARPRRIR